MFNKKLEYKGPTRLGDALYSIVIAILLYATFYLEALA